MVVELFDPGRKNEAPAGARLTYRGGPLLNSPKLFGIFLDNFPFAGEMSSFLDFFVTSDALAELREYNVNGVGTHIGDAHLSLSGSPVPPPPPVGPPPPVPGPVPCPPGCKAVHKHHHLLDIIREKSLAGSKRVDDAELQTLLAGFIDSGSVPAPDSETLFILFLPDGVSVTMGGDSSCSMFCGYHSNFAHNGGQVYYAVLPFPSCDGCLGGLSAFDALTGTTSHEISEAVTDPEGNGWYDDANGEVGDICAWQFRQDGQFNVQLEWSNQHNSCV